jgi:hypothetical protein
VGLEGNRTVGEAIEIRRCDVEICNPVEGRVVGAYISRRKLSIETKRTFKSLIGDILL